MTQPQQPFGEARAACAHCGQPLDGYIRYSVAGALHWECAQVPPQPRYVPPAAHDAHERRIAALEDECRRLRAEVERIGKAQAV